MFQDKNIKPGYKNPTKKGLDYFNVSPLLLLIYGLFSLLCGPVIPVASGFGWDGVEYGRIAMNFENLIGHLDSYRAGRVFPGVLIFYIFKVFYLSFDTASILLGFQLYYVIILVASSIIWVLIAKQLRLTSISKWIGFIALFINYPMLNFHFYYSALTDGTAFFIGLFMLYAYLKKYNAWLLIFTMLAFFTWPTGIIIGFILFIYGNIENNFYSLKPKKINLFFILLILSPLFIKLLALNLTGELKHLIVLANLDGKIFHKFSKPQDYTPVNIDYFLNSLVVILYIFLLYWSILKNFDFFGFIKAHFTKTIFFKILISACIFFVLIFLKSLLYSPVLNTLTFSDYVKAVIEAAIRLPVLYLVAHVSYWGPIIILLIIFFKEFVTHLKKDYLPVTLGFLFTVLFSINPESRPIINFYPFIVVVLIQAIDFSRIKNLKLFSFLFIFVSLLYSKIWLRISIPSSNFPESINTDFDKFPMQWYFMNFGWYMNYQMYVLHAFFAGLFFIMFLFVCKREERILTNGNL